MPARLDTAQFKQLVALGPLISIDLLVQGGDQGLLLGKRINPPAQDYWFVPGGRILKNESMDAALLRLCRDELGATEAANGARFQGVYEHFYDNDFTGEAGACTHYVVLAYTLKLATNDALLPEQQHSAYRWMDAAQAVHDTSVHPNTQAYFQALWPSE